MNPSISPKTKTKILQIIFSNTPTPPHILNPDKNLKDLTYYYIPSSYSINTISPLQHNIYDSLPIHSISSLLIISYSYIHPLYKEIHSEKSISIENSILAISNEKHISMLLALSIDILIAHSIQMI